MAGYAEAAPLLAGGPWGVVAWAVAGTALTGLTILGVGAVAHKVSESRAQPQSQARAVPKTAEKVECKQCRPYSVRVHAQGTDIGGTSGSTVGAPPLVQPEPVTVGEGLMLSAATHALLTKKQLALRAAVIAKAEKFIASCPPSGFSGQKSFVVQGVSGGSRYDVDSYGPGPNFIA